MVKFLGPILGLGVLYAIYVYVIAPPFIAVSDELTSKQADLANLKMKVRSQKRYLAEYRRWCELFPVDQDDESLALKTNPERIRDYLRDQINNILESPRIKSKFKVERILRPEAKLREPHKRKRRKLDTLSFKVTGNSDFATVMQVLLEIYKLEAPIYVSSLSIDPDDKKHSEKVKAAIELETVVIPQDDKLLAMGPSPTSQPVKDEGPVTEQMGRLGGLALSDYDILLDWKPFDPLVERPPQLLPAMGACCVADDCRMLTRDKCIELGGRYLGDNRPCSPNVCGPPVVRDEGPRRTPVVAGDPNRDSLIVCGFGSSSSEPDEVWVKKEAPVRRGRRMPGSEEEIIWYKVGDEFDGGILEMVHRLGVIVRKKNRQGDTEVLWLYPIGGRMSEGLPLEEAVETADYYREVQLDIEKKNTK